MIVPCVFSNVAFRHDKHCTKLAHFGIVSHPTFLATACGTFPLWIRVDYTSDLSMCVKVQPTACYLLSLLS